MALSFQNCCYADLALNDGSRQLSYKELFQSSKAAKEKISHQKMDCSETIGLIVDQTVSSIAVLLGVAGIDANILLLDSFQPEEEYERIGELCNVRIWIADNSQKTKLPLSDNNSFFQYDDLLESHFNSEPEKIIINENSMFLLPSSGSTGRTKIVRIPKTMVMSEGKKFSKWFGLLSKDAVLTTVPLNYMYGLSAALFGSLYNGSSLHICKNPSPRKVAKFTQDFGCTVIFSIPQMYHLLNQSDMINKRDVESLRLFITAGDKLEIEVAKKFDKKFGSKILQIYGSTETGCIAADRPNKKFLTDTVGSVMDGVKVLFSTDKRILVKSKTLFKGYLTEEGIDNPVSNNTFTTNDIGEFREDQLKVYGRYSPHIKVGARLIDPNEILQAIEKYPGVVKVEVRGEPDLTYGQRIIANVTAKHSISENKIKDFLRSILPHYKIPHIIYVSDKSYSWKKSYISVEEKPSNG